MKAGAVTSKRHYASPLRERQAARTREAIVDAVVDALAESGVEGVSFADVAQRAGVAERTVFRYFPNRQALLDEVEAAVDSRMGVTDSYGTSEDLASEVRLQFDAFERHAKLVTALRQTQLGREVRARGQRQRDARLLEHLVRLTPGMDGVERRRAAAVLRHVFGLDAWVTLREKWGLSNEQAAQAVEWAVSTLIADLSRRSAGKPSREDSPPAPGAGRARRPRRARATRSHVRNR